MRTTVDAEIDLTDIDGWELAAALVSVEGTKEAAVHRIGRVDDGGRQSHHPIADLNREHHQQMEALRERVAEALELIARGRSEEGMHKLKMLAAEETNLQEWQRIKDGRHPFLCMRPQLDA